MASCPRPCSRVRGVARLFGLTTGFSTKNDIMKICIFGAGAIGAHLGVKLANAGADVSLVARGAHLASMKANGVRLLEGDGAEEAARLRCTDDPRERGAQDYVIIALKARSAPGAVESMLPLLGDETAIVTACNGIPYWYFYRHGGAFENTPVETVDPVLRHDLAVHAGRVFGVRHPPVT